MKRNYYEYVIVCDKIGNIDNIMNEFVRKVTITKELASFNFTNKTVYLDDGSKYMFIGRKNSSKFLQGRRCIRINENVFNQLLNNFKPGTETFVDVMDKIDELC